MARMIVERSTHPRFVSNTFLVADGQGGPAFFVDAGGPVEPLIEAAEQRGLEPTHILLTHHHYDHVCEVDKLKARWPGLEVLISAREAELMGEAAESYGAIEAGDSQEFGAVSVRALATPCRAAGMLSLLAAKGSASQAVFTGDT